MRFMNSRVLKTEGVTRPLDDMLQTVIGELETELRQQAADARQTVARWSVNVEYRSAPLADGSRVLVPAQYAADVHVTVLLVTARGPQ